MTTKHTQGSWRVDAGTGYIDIRSSDNGTQICAMLPEDGTRRFTRTQEETDANARLIAAAPDLLAVVESVFLWDLSKNIGRKKPVPLHQHIVDAARAALQKAGV